MRLTLYIPGLLIIEIIRKENNRYTTINVISDRIFRNLMKYMYHKYYTYELI